MTDTPTIQRPVEGRPVNLDDSMLQPRGLDGWPPRAEDIGPLVVAGGWCAPAHLELGYLSPSWTRPDDGWATDLDVAGWLFPRWARLERAVREARRRLGLAWTALATGRAPGPACDCDREPWG